MRAIASLRGILGITLLSLVLPPSCGGGSSGSEPKAFRLDLSDTAYRPSTEYLIQVSIGKGGIRSRDDTGLTWHKLRVYT